MRNPVSLRKSKEAFVKWKESPAAGGPQNSATVATSKSGGSRPKKGMLNSSSSGIDPTHRTSLSRPSQEVSEGICSLRESQTRRRESFSVSARNAENDEKSSGGRKQVSAELRNANVVDGNAARTESPTTFLRRIVPSGKEYGVSTLSANATQTLAGDSSKRRYCMSSSNSLSAQTKVVDRSIVADCDKERVLRNADSLAWTGQTNAIPRSLWRCETATSTENEEPDSKHQDEEYGESRCVEKELQTQTLPQEYAFYMNDSNDNVIADSSEEGDAADEVQETATEGIQDALDVLDYSVVDESTKRRERRQAQAARAREGDRRRKEGLRRNFLLVDEYTKKPYGVGVGDWRKELMLLSRKLDPAIGNINRQPDGAVAEIAEWIQHTWEYSALVKFEYVKQVVARGVTLRRTDIWKRIRNNEAQPEDISDRSWRMLKRQLESPATTKKSNSCSRANAARVNFGRTGPSGEVGVRKRLRRRFRRSPEPEEIKMEMARNKGYGGRSQRSSNYQNVMHGSAEDAQFGMEVARTAEASANTYNDTTMQEKDDRQDNNIGEEVNAEVHHNQKSGEGFSQGDVINMSAQEISQHPLVIKMIQRLEALEGRQSSAVVPSNGVRTQKVTIQDAHDIEQGPEEQANSQKFQNDGLYNVELEEKKAPRKRGRPPKKAGEN